MGGWVIGENPRFPKIGPKFRGLGKKYWPKAIKVRGKNLGLAREKRPGKRV